MRITLFFGLLLSLAACDDTNQAVPLQMVALHISPENAVLQVRDDMLVEQPYAVVAEYEDGTLTDVTAAAVFMVAESRLGNFLGPNFAASGVAGGQTTVTALVEGASVDTSLTVSIARTEVVAPAPPEAPDMFAAATEDPTRAPTLVYPSDRTMFPGNLGEFDVHWTDAAGNYLFEVRLVSEYIDVRAYVVGTPNAGSWLALPPSLWQVAERSANDSALTVSVRGMSSSSPEVAGTSAGVTVEVAKQRVEGGIYYWASQSTNGPGGIYRHDMGSVATAAQQFYTTDESEGNRCVACHALSRKGDRMAITFEGHGGEGTVLDVATRTPILPIGAGLRWHFATFEPDADRVLTVSQGTLTLRDLNQAGAVVRTVPTAGYATHPDFHPQGTAIVYVQTPMPVADWRFWNGTIVTQPFDAVNATFGEPRVLVEGSGNNYYPSWSPDGQWILFNRSSEDADSDASAELYVVKADGTVPPTLLRNPNVSTGLTNSWARWAPFVQEYNDSEPYYWFTFSSQRNFGVRLVNAHRPQVWMAPFFPERALVGGEASLPAFRLPAQDLAGSNHIAQWTEGIVDVD